MKQNKFSIIKRLNSFKYTFNGLKILVKEEHNARIHLFAMICVLIAGFIFKVSINEWLSIIFAIGFVFALEIINSSIENIADFISPEKNDKIERLKDLSAAAVLVAAITTLVIGLIIFVPKILGLG